MYRKNASCARLGKCFDAEYGFRERLLFASFYPGHAPKLLFLAMRFEGTTSLLKRVGGARLYDTVMNNTNLRQRALEKIARTRQVTGAAALAVLMEDMEKIAGEQILTRVEEEEARLRMKWDEEDRLEAEMAEDDTLVAGAVARLNAFFGHF